MPALRAPLEAQVLRSCLDWLGYHGIQAFRINVGMLPNGVGGWRTNSMKGMADILGILPGGRFLAVECKTLTGRVTPDQARFMEQVNRAGGLAFVARSTLDLERELGSHGLFAQGGTR